MDDPVTSHGTTARMTGREDAIVLLCQTISENIFPNNMHYFNFNLHCKLYCHELTQNVQTFPYRI